MSLKCGFFRFKDCGENILVWGERVMPREGEGDKREETRLL
jgi:hypothetical protein